MRIRHNLSRVVLTANAADRFSLWAVLAGLMLKDAGQVLPRHRWVPVRSMPLFATTVFLLLNER
jgi:hypothetical protein